MPALVNKMELTVWDQLMKFPGNERWSNCIIIAPDETGWLLNLAYFFSQIVPDGRFSQRNYLDHLDPVVGYFKTFVTQLLGGHCRIVKGKLCFLTDIFLIPTFWVAITHTIFK